MPEPATAADRIAGAARSVEGVRTWRNAPLAPFTTFGSGGRADLLLTVETADALATVLGLLEDAGAPWVLLGGGSNVLVADGGYRGIVLKLGDGFSWVELPVRPGEPLGAGAALALPRLSTLAADRGLAGLEWACAIPGTVGGAVAMNAGAHGGCVADSAVAVELADAGGCRWVPADGIEWGYRSSGLPRGTVVTGIRLALAGDQPADILARQRSLLRHRRQTQPRGTRTFGSAFKNPPADSAGRLLEAVGMKGTRRGGAEVSRIHANFVANVQNATTTDVLGLMTMMREAVIMREGVRLEPEVRLLGADFPWASPSL